MSPFATFTVYPSQAKQGPTLSPLPIEIYPRALQVSEFASFPFIRNLWSLLEISPDGGRVWLSRQMVFMVYIQDCLAVAGQMNTMKLEARGNSTPNWDSPS